MAAGYPEDTSFFICSLLIFPQVFDERIRDSSDYAEMAIRTASKRAYLQGEGQKRQEWFGSFLVYGGFICKIKSLPVCTFGKLYSSKKALKSQRKMLVSAINKSTLLSLRSILIFRMFVPTRWLVR